MFKETITVTANNLLLTINSDQVSKDTMIPQVGEKHLIFRINKDSVNVYKDQKDKNVNEKYFIVV